MHRPIERRTGSTVILLLLSAPLLILGADGCSDWCDDIYPPIPDPSPEFDTPGHIVEGIEWAFNNEDTIYFADMLDPEFCLCSDGEDVSDRGGLGGFLIEYFDLPESTGSWNSADLTELLETLFDTIGPGNISMEFDLGDYHEPDSSEIEYAVNNVGYELQVFTPDTTYSIAGTADLVTRCYNDNDGVSRWWLWKWWDR